MADLPLPRTPSPAHLRTLGSRPSSLTEHDSREATELAPTSTPPPEDSSVTDMTSVTTATSNMTYAHGSALRRCWRFVGVHWRRHVSRHVSSGEARDHFANERTFLGALRTSLTFAVMGTLIAQLMRLQHAPNPNPVLGFYTLGVPLACMCIACAICVAVLGAVRFLHHQDAICRGKALAGGWEVYTIGGMGIVINVVSFVLVVSVDVSKSVATVVSK